MLNTTKQFVLKTLFKIAGIGVQFVSRCARYYPPSAAYMLKAGAIDIVVGAIKAMYADEVLQLEGLKFLQVTLQSLS